MGPGAHLVFAAARACPLAVELSGRIRTAGFPVRSVELDPRESDEANHEAALCRGMNEGSEPTVLAGFSLGARIAAWVCSSDGEGAAMGQVRPGRTPRGLLCFGYPFHRSGSPAERGGLETLRQVSLPTRVIQGARDSHGSEAALRGYALPSTCDVRWIPDGNHRFVPRGKSGRTVEENLQLAVDHAVSFLKERSR